METLQAFMLVIWFLMKCVGIAVFAVGIHTTVLWLAGKRITISNIEEQENELDFMEKIEKEYG